MLNGRGGVLTPINVYLKCTLSLENSLQKTKKGGEK